MVTAQIGGTKKPESRKQKTLHRVEVWIQSRQGHSAEPLKSKVCLGMSGVDGMEAAGDAQVVFRCMWEQTLFGGQKSK